MHYYDIERAALSVARVEEGQFKRSLFFPHRSDTFLGHGGGKLVFGHLDDGVGVVGAILALHPQAPSLMHRYLDTRREPLLALVGQRHREIRSALLNPNHVINSSLRRELGQPLPELPFSPSASSAVGGFGYLASPQFRKLSLVS